jgi:hypothetical protein
VFRGVGRGKEGRVSGRTLHLVERAVGWIVGVPFASWRYVSREIEIRHEESSCDWAIDAFPEDDCRHPGRPGLLQRPSGGSGAAFRRRYRVSVERPLLSADELMSIVLAGPNVACPLEIGRFECEVESSRTIELGEEMRVRLPGVESESTESPKRPGAIEEVVHEEPAPRYRIRRDDGRERIDALAAGALCKAGTRSTAEGSGRPGDGTAHLMDGPTARRAWACSKRGRVRATGTHTHLLEHARTAAAWVCWLARDRAQARREQLTPGRADEAAQPLATRTQYGVP